jgi:hypothetical protein
MSALQELPKVSDHDQAKTQQKEQKQLQWAEERIALIRLFRSSGGVDNGDGPVSWVVRRVL